MFFWLRWTRNWSFKTCISFGGMVDLWKGGNNFWPDSGRWIISFMAAIPVGFYTCVSPFYGILCGSNETFFFCVRECVHARAHSVEKFSLSLLLFLIPLSGCQVLKLLPSLDVCEEIWLSFPDGFNQFSYTCSISEKSFICYSGWPVYMKLLWSFLKQCDVIVHECWF